MPRGLIMLAVPLLLALSLCAVGCTRTAQADDPHMRELVREDIAQVMADIDKSAAEGSGVAASSNPWDYVGISPAWSRLVSRGRPALDPIASEIESSEENGLREYLLALAGNAILGEKKPPATWDTGKEWARYYRSLQ